MPLRRALPLLALALFAGGCRVKSWESFVSTVEPNPSPTWGGSKYQSAGNADATGGLDATVHYTEGAKNAQTGGFDEGFDRPTKGVGLQPGEANVQAQPGHALTNAPAFQPGPSDVGQPGADANRY